MPTPYIYIRQLGNSYQTSGLFSCFLGHKLESAISIQPDGVFAEWIWDGQRLSVQNDRYGFYPLYYFCGTNEVAVSTSIAKLVELGAPVTLNEPGLAVFLRLGFYIGEDTPFEAIKAVPPCAVFEWTNGQLQIAPQWPRSKEDQMSPESAIEGYISLFRQSIQKRPPSDPNFVVPLTGGRDSRHILLELVASGYRPKFCITAHSYLIDSDEDIKVAEQLTQALDLDHVVLKQPASRLEIELRKNITTNFCADEHAWCMAVADYLRGKTTTIYDGIAGDVLSESQYLTLDKLSLFQAGQFSSLSQILLDDYREKLLAKMLPDREYRRFSRDLATTRLIKELKKHTQAPNPIGSFYFFNRTRREIALSPYSILSDIGVVFSPYLDHQLYDFLTSLPASMFLDRSFHTKTIKRAYPAFSNTPYGKKYTAPNHSYWYYNRFGLELAKYVYLDSLPRSVRHSYVALRFFRCFVDKHYSVSLEWWLGVLAAYLIQLERFCKDQ